MDELIVNGLDGVSIRAHFKKAVIQGGTAQLQFDVLTEDGNAFKIAKKSGKNVILTVTDLQKSIEFDDETGEVWSD